MGRPLNKKYMGNRNVGTTGTADNGIGGESVASVTISGSWAGFTGATTTVTFSAPELPGGVLATGTAVINGGGAVTGVTITEKGSGYVSVPTVTIVDTDVGAETTGTATAVLTTDSGNVGSSTNQENAILAYAYIGGSLRLVDLVKQISTKRYKVRYNGTNYTARIRYDAIADGSAGYTAAEGVELNMVAIDGSNGTYLVRKLYNRTCTLKSLAINNSTIGITNNTAGTVFTDNKQYKWTFGTATSDTVKIQNA